MKPLDKLTRESVQAELQLARALRARSRAINRLVDARRAANETRKLYLARQATEGAYRFAVQRRNQARGVWARAVTRSEAARARAFDARFELREAQRSGAPL